jgi:hypothetical protein
MHSPRTILARRRALALAAIAVAGAALALSACGDGDESAASSGATTSAVTEGAEVVTGTPTGAGEAAVENEEATAELDDLLRDLAVGDDMYSTDGPRAGYLYSCTEGSPNAGGASSTPWIEGGRWSFDEKPVVEGSVDWPDATYSVSASGSSRTLSGNGLPVRTPTGTFPIAQSDPAYQYDRNPGSVGEQAVDYGLPVDPELADEPSCVPMGAVGYLENGVALFNAIDARGDDAPANEVQDACQGHPAQDQYHYHWVPTCLLDEDPVDERSPVVGWALDGFPIVGPRGEGGEILGNGDLDECHGRTDTIEIDGEMVRTYHYVANYEYPYTVACFRGTEVAAQQAAGPQGGGGPVASAAGHDHDGHAHERSG